MLISNLQFTQQKLAISAARFHPKPNPQIYGGYYTQADYPFYCSIIPLSHKYAIPKCGCCILSTLHALSAAHCLKNETLFFILAAVSDLSKIRKENIYLPQSVLIHKEFSSEKGTNDLGFVRPRVAFRLGSRIRPANINPFIHKNFHYGLILGFGNTGNGASTLLKYAYIFDESNICNTYNFSFAYLPGQTFCSICYIILESCPGEGDSGGPLVAFFQGDAYVVGIISARYRINDYIIYIYSNVSRYYEWIIQSLNTF